MDPNLLTLIGKVSNFKKLHKQGVVHQIPNFLFHINLPFLESGCVSCFKEFIPLKDTIDNIIEEKLQYFLIIYNKRFFPVFWEEDIDFDVNPYYNNLFKNFNSLIEYHKNIIKLLEKPLVKIPHILNYKINK